MSKRLKDRDGRYVNYLRLSVTDRCNLRCSYCTPKEMERMDHDDILRYEEMLKIAEILSEQGIEKIRLTGGEPLVRKDLHLFIKDLCRLKNIREVTLTTNATLLSANMDDLLSSGIKRINISLDTLNPKIYEKLTGRDMLYNVLEGIDAALLSGLFPVKINAVLLRGINDEDIEELVLFSIKKNIQLRFIELMPIGSKAFYEDHYYPANFAIKRIEKEFGPLERIKNSELSGPASMYKINGIDAKIGFIHAMTDHFCGTCNRLRLSADGRLRPCLLKDFSVDLKRDLRSGKGDKALMEKINYGLNKKSSFHDLLPDVETKMVSIGG